MLFSRNCFAATLMNGLRNALNVRSVDLYAAFGGKGSDSLEVGRLASQASFRSGKNPPDRWPDSPSETDLLADRLVDLEAGLHENEVRTTLPPAVTYGIAERTPHFRAS
ncbi:MAG: hypothetical protein JWR89_5242 [Tardiphaga sp.]|nr:hypothetical protein [Tardiphaga sp.]